MTPPNEVNKSIHTCYGCGQRVTIYSSEEGTNSYEGVAEKEVLKLRGQLKEARKMIHRLAEKLRLLRLYDSGSHSPETVEDIIAEAGREIGHE